MLSADQAIALSLFIILLGVLGVIYLTIRVLCWLTWRAVRGRVREEIARHMRHAVMVKRGAKGQFAK